MPNLIASIALIFSLVGMNGCAPEQSDEERRREEVERQTDRLKQAGGRYVGLVRTPTGETLPISLTNRVQRNPQDGSDKPLISSEMRIGLFGGAYLVSSDTSYDFGEKFFVAKFYGENHSHPIEVRIKIDGTDSIQGVLESSQESYSVELISGVSTPFFGDLSEVTFFLGLQPGMKLNSDTADALLSLNPQSKNQKSFPGSELPVLPGIDGSIRFVRLASNSIGTVNYDPLRGTLELLISEQSRITFNGLYVGPNVALKDQGKYQPTHLTGQLSQGGDVIEKVSLTKVSPQLNLGELETGVAIADYQGTFQGKPGAPTFTAYARLVSLQSEGTNPHDNPFPKFRRLQLTTIVCSLRPKYRRLELSAIDYLNAEAVFDRSNGVAASARNSVDETIVWYSRDWGQLDGVLTNPGPAVGSGSREQPQFQLTRTAESIPTRPCEE